ncbi:hypothetical protein CU100_07300 [Phyllobacterium endophyticum]|uniref:Uncharacterized protein n=1 Tax=Phyllobacterium endophyticum TaxID=1149773 RepID=A0A2P7B201_9HYPH|nr:hypothetical protein CU100_07300 [Phyllobacterium endophyticum]
MVAPIIVINYTVLKFKHWQIVFPFSSSVSISTFLSQSRNLLEPYFAENHAENEAENTRYD